MSRDSGAHGVQVVGGSNPPCPTNHNPNPPPVQTDLIGRLAPFAISRPDWKRANACRASSDAPVVKGVRRIGTKFTTTRDLA
jgi:hypothetical protein